MQIVEEIKFNEFLWSSLFRYLNVTATEVSNVIGTCSRDTIIRSVKTGKVRMPILVRVCNAYRLDVKKFFDGGVSLLDLQVPKEEWTPVRYVTDAVTNYSCKVDCMYADKLAAVLSSRELRVDDVLIGGRVVSPNDSKYVERHCDAIVSYNSILFNSLPALLNIEQSKIGSLSGHSGSTFANAIRCGDVTIGTLVDICNTFYIDISHFFSECGDGIIPKDLFADKSDWTVIRFIPSRMKLLYIKNSPFGFSFTELASKLGYTRSKLMLQMSSSSPMRASTLVRICNILHISPMLFFEGSKNDDDNFLVSAYLTKRIARLEEELAYKEKEIKALRAELNQKVQKTEEDE